MEPIGPKHDRTWPPPHCYMDADGRWWEAPGVPLEIKAAVSDIVIENCHISSAHGYGIYVPSGVMDIEISGGVHVEKRDD